MEEREEVSPRTRDLPDFPLHGGPYDGMTTQDVLSHSEPAYGVIFLPGQVHVRGSEGSAVYVLEKRDDGKHAIFDHFG